MWTQSRQWTELKNKAQALSCIDSGNFSPVFQVFAGNISLDFRHQLMNERVLSLLTDLAADCGLQEAIADLFSGRYLNHQEAVLHTALRDMEGAPIHVAGKDILPGILEAREAMRHICEKVRSGSWLGFSGEAVTDIVNIGIGGSDLGPRFCIHALKSFTAGHLGYHFISDADPNAFEQTVLNLRPETTLFIVCSKSFTTRETLYNARKAMRWYGNHDTRQHFIAVTQFHEKAAELGIHHHLPVWGWVGGRYSVSSAVNLITAIAIGYERFLEFLQGAWSMDSHFKSARFAENLPVLLALTGIWNNNFLAIHNHLILVYARQLEYLVPYVQQLDMESNGKSTNKQHAAISYATGPIIWGGPGNQAQHSYYQLLCQGTHKIAADLISVSCFENELLQDLLHAKKRILARGVTDEKEPYNYIPRNVYFNDIQLKECSPETMGSLIALYEHKIFVQGVIWNINSFDQPGVETAKKAFKASVPSVPSGTTVP